ncbi:MAG: GNAT family N-acetyltransferase [Ruminococcus sp.]|jgi:GNAT superfamily N-acetyltransferase|nr:GNAT family N-acetyltransferase [Ruminococcus sp.]
MVKIIVARASDCDTIMSLVRRQYGLLNYDVNLYKKDALRMLIMGGQYKFFIAKNDDTPAGMVCLKANEHFHGTFEGCTLTVLPEFRGQGIAKQLMDRMREEFPALNAASVFYSILTNSQLEQKREFSNGFIPTGLALNRFLYDKSAANNTADYLRTRRHHLFMVKPLKKTTTSKLYIPPELEAAALEMYKTLGVTITDEPCPKGKPEWVYYEKHFYSEFLNCLPFEISLGKFTNVFLDMQNPDCISQFYELKDKGYAFTGFKPLQSDCEFIIMHKGDLSMLKETDTLDAFDAIKSLISQ